MRGFIKVTFQPLGQSVYVPAGETALDAALEGGLELHTPCGGHGTCGGCRVVFVSAAPEPTREDRTHLSESEIEAGVRLACRAKLYDDSVISVPETTLRKDSKFLLHGIMREVTLRPSIEKIHLRVTEATLEDQRADADMLMDGLKALGREATLSHAALGRLPGALRAEGHNVTAVMDESEVICVEGGDTSGALYAAAFDIGTTTVVGMLLDLNTGAEVAVAARTNPQVSYGDDVVSRISYAEDGGLAKLHGAVTGCVNEIIDELASEAGISRRSIYQAVFCGNTTMSHLFLGIEPTYVAQAPYVAVFRGAVRTSPAAVGIEISPDGRVVVLPNVAGFIGGDTVGVMLAADFAHSEKLRMAVDIGTNGEIVIGTSTRMLCASAAAGPAFEGARIRHGMRAAEGAIETIRIEDGRLVISTINDAPAAGLCGTGLIDAVAALLDAGLVESTGRLVSADEIPDAPEDLRRRLQVNSTGPVFVLADPETDGAARQVALSQRDIRELQLAKGAIQAAITILLKEYGVAAGDLDEILLAGAFGNYISRESALRIGLLPDVPPERITQIGNAAGTGSKLVALDKDLLEEAERLSLDARYLELAGRADFQEVFAESMMFP